MKAARPCSACEKRRQAMLAASKKLTTAVKAVVPSMGRKGPWFKPRGKRNG